MSITINAQSFDIGDTIKFSTLNPKDTRVWQGTVIGIAGYQIASNYGDVINYYQQVKAGLTNPNQISLLDQTQFILVNTETDSGRVIKPMSPEWILPESFKVVKNQTSYVIQVYTHNSESVSTVLQLLRDNGFTCKSLS